MLTTIGPYTAAGMPLQRTPNGFLAKRMRPRAEVVAVAPSLPIRSIGSKTGPALKSKALRADRSGAVVQL